jgi:transcriptional regulator with XRE-family HTH domain
MSSKSKNFGSLLNKLRIDKELSLRDVCKLTHYDPSNWSKIERGKMPPPSDEKILTKWAKILGLKDKKDIQNFIDEALIVQGMIPKDVLSNSEVVEHLPAFFRTLRNKKPTKEEIDKLIELIKKA